MSPYYIISDHCVRERALVASYFGQVIGQYFFLEHCRRRQATAAAAPPCCLATLEKFLVGCNVLPMTAYGLGSSEVGQPKPKSESCSRRQRRRRRVSRVPPCAAVFKSVPSQCTAHNVSFDEFLSDCLVKNRKQNKQEINKEENIEITG